MNVNYLKLEKAFNDFSDFVEEKDKKKFTSFSSQYIYKHEKYKEEVYARANEVLKLEEWTKGQIGTKEIAQKVIDAIEVEDNNLIWTRDRHGPGTAEHAPIIEVMQNNPAEIEKILWNHFIETLVPSKMFSSFRELLGKKYPLISYLFFIRNKRKFVPLRTGKFETAFNLIGADLKLSHQASYENYNKFLEIINEVRAYLDGELKETVSLLDTHSFLWILASQMQDERKDKNGKKKEAEINLEVTLDLMELDEVKKDGKKNIYDSKNDTDPIYFDMDDHIQQERKNKQTGNIGEQAVAKFERNKLISEEKNKYADKVKIVSEDISLGYDVFSCSLDGAEKHIEVKTSVGKYSHFFLSAFEYERAQNDPDYWIYVVHTVLDNPRIVLMIKGGELLNNDRFRIIPESLKVNFNPKK